MSIDINGGMIVGESGSKLEAPEDYEDNFNEWAEEMGFDMMHEHCDAGQDRTYYGFEVADVTVSLIQGEWLSEVKEKAREFKEITGVEARLIGTQHVF